ncbi:hypothetical protein CR513_21506, partial [Mucuna pruriens]
MWNDLQATWSTLRDNLDWKIHNDSCLGLFTQRRKSNDVVCAESQDREPSSKIAYNLFFTCDIFITTEQRLKEHITQSTTCPVCAKRHESILHLIRNCIKVRNVWWCLLGGRYLLRFFLDDVME